ncbi:MAG: hypothetical protein N3B14_02675 [Thermoleophilia bacterium]|nr:hypothetical protein [Thermoleophilia bacterium]
MTIDSTTIRRVPTGPARKGPTGIEPRRITAGQPGAERAKVKRFGHRAVIEATRIYYKTLNEQIRELVEKGATEIVLEGVRGQRYIGTGLACQGVTVIVNGVPGNDLAAFMDGPTLIVNDGAQDGVANTMNSGLVVVRGHAGDVIGYGMRGGAVYVQGDVGYRVGIHMKAFEERVPLIVIGGRARDFLGEYMAGGEIVVLGLHDLKKPAVGSYVGTGMHGGVMYVRGPVSKHQLGREVCAEELSPADEARLEAIIRSYCEYMACDCEEILGLPFVKIRPYTSRPYGRMYAY